MVQRQNYSGFSSEPTNYKTGVPSPHQHCWQERGTYAKNGGGSYQAYVFGEKKMSNEREINGKTYEIVSEFYDNGDSSSVAKTIVEEGEGVNTYRIIIACITL